MRVFLTGASQNVGHAIAVRLAERYGSNLIVGMLARPRESLHRVATDVSEHGSTPFQLGTDVRNVPAVRASVSDFLRVAGGLDVLINAASTSVPDTTRQANEKKMSLLYEVNTRGTMVCIDACRNALMKSATGAIVTVAPPIRMGRLDWLKRHGVPYTVSKYSMTLATLAEASPSLRANCIWPRHAIGRTGRNAEEFATAVVHLAEDDSLNARCLFDDDVVPLPSTRAPLDAYAEDRVVWDRGPW